MSNQPEENAGELKGSFNKQVKKFDKAYADFYVEFHKSTLTDVEKKQLEATVESMSNLMDGMRTAMKDIDVRATTTEALKELKKYDKTTYPENLSIDAQRALNLMMYCIKVIASTLMQLAVEGTALAHDGNTPITPRSEQPETDRKSNIQKIDLAQADLIMKGPEKTVRTLTEKLTQRLKEANKSKEKDTPTMGETPAKKGPKLPGR